MAKRNPRARYVLPITIDPADSICYCIPVHNDPFHVAAFMGQIYALGRAYSWSDDPDHLALDTAAIWLEIFNNLSTCVTPTFRQNESCILEVSLDGGDTWDGHTTEEKYRRVDHSARIKAAGTWVD